ncbi:MAG: substrate-binding domain-containing protein [Rhodospirillales bacterium]|nr:substrate-binding domain-containing protein [Rhodospirillales bacterium]
MSVIGKARGLLAGAAALGLLALIAAPLPARAGDKPISIAFVSGPLNDSFFPPLYQGAQDAAKALGVKLHYIPIDEADIEATSARTMQIAIAQKPDAIVVGDFVTSVVDPYIKQAVAAGIPVYVDQSGQDQWKADGAFGFVGQQGPEVGQVSAARLASAGAKDILCVINVPGNPYLQAICKGLAGKARALGLTSSNLELPTADSTDQAKVSRDIGAYLQSHKKIDGVFTENAAVGTAATAAVDAAGLTGKVHVATMEISRIALEQIKNGKLEFLVNEQPYLDGYFAVVFAALYAKYGLAPVGPVATGPSIVDKSNIEKILKVFDTYPNVIGSK